MTLLAIDTSAKIGAVCLWQDGQDRGTYVLSATGGHAANLHSTIRQLLQDAELTMDAISGIAVCHGPGGFTGVRVGLATAKAMAFSLEIPLYAVSSLHATARMTSQGPVASVLDARQAQVFYALYDESMQLQGYERVAAPEDAAETLRAYKPALIGSGVSRYPEIFAEFHVIDAESLLVHSVARIATERAPRGEADDQRMVLPNYVRDSYAERRHGGS